MIFDILTLFPNMFAGVFSESIIGRAIKLGLVSIEIHNIRDYSDDERHKTVDDYPYGGEAGMVLKPEPVAKAIVDAKEKLKGKNPIVIYLTPRGEPLTQEIVKEFLGKEAIIILCGRYKGVDERICEKYVDREISIGDFVLSGGEIAAMALVDAIVRLIPGALGNRESAESDSFYNILLAPPQYTRPEVFEGMRVPEVLLSGHHAKIEEWKHKISIEITKKRRPDLWKKYLEINENKGKKKL
ncbi:MAG: tRNA (guanosine(37)-N1)-methyltransferase TrmD [Chitinispirillaceae bacterium]|nr:tRNA (guanosine(37)-N1)-methyltransferase TrmD [Chitinispirillaceae bacterium]